METYKRAPRGIRNNNPGNIRIGNKWKGLKTPNTDGAFDQFATLEHGYRALLKTLQTYIRRYKRDTLEAIIYRWAPPHENNTEAYIKRVTTITGIGKGQRILADDRQTLCSLALAISTVENGMQVGTMETVYRAWSML